MDNTKEFLVSVGDVMGFDVDTDELLFDATTLIKSDIKINSSKKEIQGGNGSLAQYIYNYNKKFNVEIEDTQTREAFWALCNGTTINKKMKEFFNRDEAQTIKNGEITLNDIPVNRKVFVKSEDGETILTKSAIGKSVKIPEFKEGETVTCTYQIKTSVDTMNIDGDKFGRTIRLVLLFKMSRQGHDGYKEVTITVPKFKITSDMELNLTHDGVTTSKLVGEALAFGKNHYATIDMRRVDQADEPIQRITTEAEVILNDGEKFTPEVFGYRGSVYAPMLIENTDLIITSEKPEVAKIGVLSNDIEYVGEGETMVTIKLKSNEHVKDYMNVVCNKKVGK